MEIEEILEREKKAEEHSHAYLFVGRDEQFLRNVVLSFFKEMGILSTDLSEIEPSKESGKSGQITVESLRGLIHEISLSPHGRLRAGVIYNAEKLNNSSANILLKTLEEPPPKSMIVLVALSDSVLPTIKSRCRTIKVNRRPVTGSITFSYTDFIKLPLYQVFANVEAIVQKKQTAKFLTDLTDQYEEKMLADRDRKSSAVLEKIIQTEKRIANNANARLALENLVLFMRSNND